MSLTCGFYDSQENDRLYFNTDLSNFLEGLIEDGIYEFVDQHMIPEANVPANLSIKINAGRAWFNGTWTKITSPEVISFSDEYAPDPITSRIDAICLTVNKTRPVRDNYIEIIKGTGVTSNPQKPVVTDESNIFRHVLAYVTIPAGCTAITQAQIENRVGMDSARFSAPKWGNIPTTEEMVAQWQVQFDEFMDHIHETFDYDAAGHLQTEIDSLNNDVGDIINDISVMGRSVANEFSEMREDFQAGVDAVYNACVAEGVTPSASTPTAIAQAIATIRNGGNATAAQILSTRTAYSGKTLLTGTMTNKGAWTGTGTPSGNNQVNVTIPAGYHNGSGYVACNGQTAYSAGYAAAKAKVQASYNNRQASYIRAWANNIINKSSDRAGEKWTDQNDTDVTRWSDSIIDAITLFWYDIVNL